MIMKNRVIIILFYVLIWMMISNGVGPPCPICENCKASSVCGDIPLYSADGLNIAECITKCDQVTGCKLIEYEPNFSFCKLYDCTVLDTNAAGYRSLLCSASCGNPPAPANGAVALTRAGVATVGATATQTCNSGYTRNGGALITCQYTSSWSTSSTCSIKDCGQPPFPNNGAVILTNSGITTYGATAIQSCDEGFELTGVATLQCQASGSWSSSATCNTIDCGTPPSPDHGSVTLTSPGETTYGATATQSCDEGYSISGVTLIQCRNTGLWSSTVTCTVKDCGNPPSPVNGAVVLTSPGVTTYEATATQSCDEGYDLTGVTEIHCQAIGSWSSTVTCIIKDCGIPPTTAHGVVMLSNLGETTYGTTATLVCDERFSPGGVETIHCQANGTWSSTVTCIVTDCGAPPSPDNGKVLSNSSMENKYGATAIQSCDKGYDQSGNDIIYCQADATWSQSINCTIRDCGLPDAPSDGTIVLAIPNLSTYGAFANYTCDAGYNLIGLATIECQSNGSWTGEAICEIQDCGALVSPTDGNVTLTIPGITTYGAVAIYTCVKGYYINGNETVVCQTSGSWSGSAVCQIKDCGNPSEPTNGTMTSSVLGRTTFGATAQYFCDEGYELVGPEIIECEASGSWTGSSTCNIKDCGNPSEPTSGSVSLTLPGKTTYSATAIYSCDEGYDLIGDENIECKASGLWSDSSTCSPKDCGTPPEITNGSISLIPPGITHYLAIAVYSCDEGHDLLGNGTAVCEATGSWSGSATCKMKDCGNPPTPTNGNVTLTKLGITTFSSTAKYFCQEGHDMLGNETIECEASGFWSGSATCQLADCSYPPLPINGTIALSIANLTSYGATAVYSCNEGFDPTSDETIICKADGKWSETPTCTIKDCKDPPQPSDGTVKLTVSGLTTYGATANQYCNGGYDMIGDGTIYCQADGTWSNSISCILKDYIIGVASTAGVLGLGTASAAAYLLKCREGNVQPLTVCG